MSILDKVFKKPLSRYTTVELTELGKTKAEQFEASGPRFTILGYLDENGPSSIEEMGEKSGLGARKVAKVVERLVKENQVRVMRSAESE